MSDEPTDHKPLHAPTSNVLQGESVAQGSQHGAVDGFGLTTLQPLPLMPDHTEDTSPTCVPTALDLFDFDTDDGESKPTSGKRGRQAEPVPVSDPLRRQGTTWAEPDLDASTSVIVITTAMVTAAIIGGIWFLLSLT